LRKVAFLTLAEILEIHKDQIARYGGKRGLRDPGLLESAIHVPQSSFGGKFLHSSLYKMAASYAYHIAENQPFFDGNKRAGLASALVFLELNGISVDDPKGELYDAMMAITSHQLTKDGLSRLLKRLAGKYRP
jgi:death-on-curing protein